METTIHYRQIENPQFSGRFFSFQEMKLAEGENIDSESARETVSFLRSLPEVDRIHYRENGTGPFSLPY